MKKSQLINQLEEYFWSKYHLNMQPADMADEIFTIFEKAGIVPPMHKKYINHHYENVNEWEPEDEIY